MGHIVNPIAMRIGWFSNWSDIFFVKLKYYPEYLHSILRLRRFLFSFLTHELWEGCGYFHSHFTIVQKYNSIYVDIFIYDGQLYSQRIELTNQLEELFRKYRRSFLLKKLLKYKKKAFHIRGKQAGILDDAYYLHTKASESWVFMQFFLTFLFILNKTNFFTKNFNLDPKASFVKHPFRDPKQFLRMINYFRKGELPQFFKLFRTPKKYFRPSANFIYDKSVFLKEYLSNAFYSPKNSIINREAIISLLDSSFRVTLPLSEYEKIKNLTDDDLYFFLCNCFYDYKGSLNSSLGKTINIKIPKIYKSKLPVKSFKFFPKFKIRRLKKIVFINKPKTKDVLKAFASYSIFFLQRPDKKYIRASEKRGYAPLKLYIEFCKEFRKNSLIWEKIKKNSIYLWDISKRFYFAEPNPIANKKPIKNKISKINKINKIDTEKVYYNIFNNLHKIYKYSPITNIFKSYPNFKRSWNFDQSKINYQKWYSFVKNFFFLQFQKNNVYMGVSIKAKPFIFSPRRFFDMDSLKTIKKREWPIVNKTFNKLTSPLHITLLYSRLNLRKKFIIKNTFCYKKIKPKWLFTNDYNLWFLLKKSIYIKKMFFRKNRYKLNLQTADYYPFPLLKSWYRYNIIYPGWFHRVNQSGFIYDITRSWFNYYNRWKVYWWKIRYFLFTLFKIFRASKKNKFKNFKKNKYYKRSYKFFFYFLLKNLIGANIKYLYYFFSYFTKKITKSNVYSYLSFIKNFKISLNKELLEKKTLNLEKYKEYKEHDQNRHILKLIHLHNDKYHRRYMHYNYTLYKKYLIFILKYFMSKYKYLPRKQIIFLLLYKGNKNLRNMTFYKSYQNIFSDQNIFEKVDKEKYYLKDYIKTLKNPSFLTSTKFGNNIKAFYSIIYKYNLFKKKTLKPLRGKSSFFYLRSPKIYYSRRLINEKHNPINYMKLGLTFKMKYNNNRIIQNYYLNKDILNNNFANLYNFFLKSTPYYRNKAKPVLSDNWLRKEKKISFKNINNINYLNFFFKLAYTNHLNLRYAFFKKKPFFVNTYSHFFKYFKLQKASLSSFTLRRFKYYKILRNRVFLVKNILFLNDAKKLHVYRPKNNKKFFINPLKYKKYLELKLKLKKIIGKIIGKLKINYKKKFLGIFKNYLHLGSGFLINKNKKLIKSFYFYFKNNWLSFILCVKNIIMRNLVAKSYSLSSFVNFINKIKLNLTLVKNFFFAAYHSIMKKLLRKLINRYVKIKKYVLRKYDFNYSLKKIYAYTSKKSSKKKKLIKSKKKLTLLCNEINRIYFTNIHPIKLTFDELSKDSFVINKIYSYFSKVKNIPKNSDVWNFCFQYCVKKIRSLLFTFHAKAKPKLPFQWSFFTLFSCLVQDELKFRSKYGSTDIAEDLGPFLMFLLLLHNISKPFFISLIKLTTSLLVKLFNQFINVSYLLISNNQVTGPFLSRYIAIKLRNGYSVWELLNPIRKDLSYVRSLTERPNRLFYSIFLKGLRNQSQALKYNSSLFIFLLKFLIYLYNKISWNSYCYETLSWLTLDFYFLFFSLNHSNVKNKEKISYSFLYFLRRGYLSLLIKHNMEFSNIFSAFLKLNSNNKTFPSFIKTVGDCLYDDFNSPFESLCIWDKNLNFYINQELLFAQNLYFKRYFKHTKNQVNYDFLIKYLGINKRTLRLRDWRKNKMGLLGFKISCSGRFSRRDRASHISFIKGKVPLNTLQCWVDYGFWVIPIKNSAICVKVWMNRGTDFKPYDKRFSL